tara:strand:+ start:2529 stop:4580 length:2052 start_codon:yes stop_codon:yes gene_type:complete
MTLKLLEKLQIIVDKNTINYIEMNGILTLLALLMASSTQKTNDEVLLTVGPEEVTVSDFQSVFQKNNNLEEVTAQEMEDYLDLFVKFKMKVLDAKAMQLDTAASFQKELAGYRKQLARPYLTDKQAEESLISEAYGRMKQEVRASHILLLVDENALPKDTLDIYNRINSMRSKILNGEDFESVAKAYSEDPSAKSNGGDLGYFSAFRMVYPFETAAFNTEVGTISKPFRTRFGYHIVKTTDKRSSRGEVKVAHIMIEQKSNATEQEKKVAVDRLDQLLDFFKQGKSFDELVRYSDDNSSSKQGGELPWFSTGQMVAEFEEAAFTLENKGDISAPIQTIYGWHILKLIDKKDVPTLEEATAEIEQKIKRDSRVNKGRKVLIKKIKSEDQFREYKSALLPFYDIDFEDNWNANSISTNRVLFTLNRQKYTQSDFATYIERNKTPIDQTKIISTINQMYQDWVEKTCVNLEDSRLEDKYPEFAALIQEYRDGILLFDLMDQKVWGKAVKDSIGLKQYYELTKDNYQWSERVDATVFTCLNEEIAKRVRKLLSSTSNVRLLSSKELSLLSLGKGEHRLSVEDIQTVINNENPLSLQIESAKFSKGDNEHLDANSWEPGLTKNVVNEGVVTFANIYELLDPSIKTLEEAKGQVISNFQDYLEASWINELEGRYPVTINQEILNSIISK